MIHLDYFTLRLFLDGMLFMMALYALAAFSWYRQSLYLFYGGYLLCLIGALQCHDLSYFYQGAGSFAAWGRLAENAFQTVAFLLYIRLALVLLRQRKVVVVCFIGGTLLFAGGILFALLMDRLGWTSRQPNVPFSFPLIATQLGFIAETLLFTMALSLANRQTDPVKAPDQQRLNRPFQENQQEHARIRAIRDEIAQNLHDELGSQLSAISILSQTTCQLTDTDLIRQRLITIGQTARQVTDAMRVIVWSLSSSSNSLEHLSLRIQETAYSLFSDSLTQVHIDWKPSDHPPVLSQKQKQELDLIARECLTNVVRHAQARHIWIQFRDTPSGLFFTIRDDGTGFNPHRLTSGLGLSGVRKRASRIGAALTIESAPASGTTVALHLPAKPAVEQPVHSQPWPLPSTA